MPLNMASCEIMELPASMAEVFDVVSAYDAIGLIEVEPRLPRHEAPASGGLLARLIPFPQVEPAHPDCQVQTEILMFTHDRSSQKFAICSGIGKFTTFVERNTASILPGGIGIAAAGVPGA